MSRSSGGRRPRGAVRRDKWVGETYARTVESVSGCIWRVLVRACARETRVLTMADTTSTPSSSGVSSGCDVCGKVATEGDLQRCGQCGWRCYCGAECQRKDWKQMGHRHVCKAIVGVRRGELEVDLVKLIGEADLAALIKDDRVEEVRELLLSGTVGINET